MSNSSENIKIRLKMAVPFDLVKNIGTILIIFHYLCLVVHVNLISSLR